MNTESAHRTPPPPPLVSEPAGEPYSETREFGLWTVLGVFALGAAIGAGAAVLAVPDSGSKTRRRVGRRLRKLTGRERTAWDKLGRTLHRAIDERRIQRRAERLAEEKAAAEG